MKSCFMKHFQKFAKLYPECSLLLSVRCVVKVPEIFLHFTGCYEFLRSTFVQTWLTTLVYFESREKVVLPKQRLIRPSPANPKLFCS